MDLFAEPGTPVYACIRSKFTRIYTSKSLAGRTIVTQVLDVENFKSLKKDYALYIQIKEKVDVNFNYDGLFYLVFYHLQKNDFLK